jgi:LPXTG-motif cell wall-anchored protein
VKITNTTGVKTGDEHNILIPMAGMLAAILALLIMIIRRRKYNA